MKYVIAIFCIISCLQCKVEEGLTTDYQAVIYRSEAGHELPYRVLFPAKYNKNKKYPLLLFLHGAGERGDDNLSQLVHISNKFSEGRFRTEYPAIVVFPQCKQDDYWAEVDRVGGQWFVQDTERSTPSMEALLEMMEEFIVKEAVDKERIYVAGLSMGGFGTFDLLQRRPEWFAAAVPICGGGNVEFVDRYKHVPIWMFHGRKDPVVPVRLSRELSEAFEKREMNFSYTEYPEGGHDVWTQAWSEPELIPWLFSQRK